MAETTLNSAAAWSPDVNTFAPAEAVPDALILNTSTVSGQVEGDAPALRVAYVDDANATFTAESDVIPDADPVLDEALVYTAKITQLVTLSNEQFRQGDTPGQIATSVQRAVTKKANQAYLSQAAPTGGATAPPAGLLNIAGIETGGAVSDDLDALVDLIATLEASGADPSHIVLDPTGWASLRKFKTATGSNAALLGAGTTDATRQLLDLPVIVTPAMTAGTGLVIDRGAVVSAVGPVRIARSEHALFSSDSVALRATWRIGWNLVRPERIGTFTVTAPAAE